MRTTRGTLAAGDPGSRRLAHGRRLDVGRCGIVMSSRPGTTAGAPAITWHTDLVNRSSGVTDFLP